MLTWKSGSLSLSLAAHKRHHIMGFSGCLYLRASSFPEKKDANRQEPHQFVKWTTRGVWRSRSGALLRCYEGLRAFRGKTECSARVLCLTAACGVGRRALGVGYWFCPFFFLRRLLVSVHRLRDLFLTEIAYRISEGRALSWIFCFARRERARLRNLGGIVIRVSLSLWSTLAVFIEKAYKPFGKNPLVLGFVCSFFFFSLFSFYTGSRGWKKSVNIMLRENYSV